MLIALRENTIKLCPAQQLDIAKTFECGQCFRWDRQEDGSYIGVAGRAAARLFEREDEVYITHNGGESEQFWLDYFDLPLDYEKLRLSFDAGDYLKKCAEFGAGIRILRQDKWEALCSFIISQCNNIPRIKKIIKTLCECFGETISFEGKDYYLFPDAQRIAQLEESDLAPLRCGYRAAYIISAARRIASGEADLEELAKTDAQTAKKELLAFSGVGEKVANCAVLFGLHHMSAFPIDVWMKRALRDHFPKNFEPATLGEWAGLAQQYIFFYERSGGAQTS